MSIIPPETASVVIPQLLQTDKTGTHVPDTAKVRKPVGKIVQCSQIKSQMNCDDPRPLT